VNARLVELAGVTPGARVLDVATGLGEPAISAARAVGPRGRVVGVDFSPGMLARAGERVRAAGLANVELLEQDAHALDLEDASFDAAVSRWGLMLLLDPPLALREIRRVLRPGARLAAAVWAGADEVPFIALPGRVARAVLGTDPPAPDAPGPFRYGEPGALAAVVATAGFASVEEETLRVTFDFADEAAFVAFLEEVSSSFRNIVAQASAEDLAAVRAALLRAARELRAADGRLRLSNRTRIIRARRPA
jgi:SAM-dependent methyltransferase